MSKVYIQLGKLGDILNLLPVLKSIQPKPTLMVAKKYAEVLDSVSYVEKLVFDGEWPEIGRAVDQVVKLKRPFVVTQVCGWPADTLKYVYKPAGTERAVTDCWQKESYRVAGSWKLWRQQPRLVIDQRSKEREQALISRIKPGKRMMLVACGGETVRFKPKNLLMELLKNRFGKTFNIVDLDAIKAERFVDFLGLYDIAHCLIAADSAHLHLAHASDVMVMALTNDKPSLWHGSAWRPQHFAYCRYGDFADRAIELMDRIKSRIVDVGAIPKSVSVMHVWSQYDLTDENQKRHDEARKSWSGMFNCEIEIGSCGRDSTMEPIKDKTRHPYVKDVLLHAEMLGTDSSLVVMSGPDVTFDKAIDQMGWASRIEVREGCETFNRRSDVLSFPLIWWKQVRDKYPDMIMGKDSAWKQVLKDMIRKDGGVDMTGNVSWHE